MVVARLHDESPQDRETLDIYFSNTLATLV